jgi:hypothetical protein
MKKVFPFIICVLLLGIACSEESKELTDEQKTTIISEVEKQMDGKLSAAIQLDFDAYSEYLSKDGFISANTGS